jgi:hypothetical protein
LKRAFSRPDMVVVVAVMGERAVRCGSMVKGRVRWVKVFRAAVVGVHQAADSQAGGGDVAGLRAQRWVNCIALIDSLRFSVYCYGLFIVTFCTGAFLAIRSYIHQHHLRCSPNI